MSNKIKKKEEEKKLSFIEQSNEDFFEKYDVDEDHRRKVRKFSREFQKREEKRLRKIEERRMIKEGKKANETSYTIKLIVAVCCLFLGYMIIDGNFAFFELFLD